MSKVSIASSPLYNVLINSFPWALICILYLSVFYQLYTIRWEYIDYTHAYFVLPVSLWLVWRDRNELSKLIAKENSKSTTLIATLLLVFGLLLYIIGWRHDYLLISTFSLIPVLFGLILYLYGEDVAKAVLFPVFYLVLLIPPPLGMLDAITLPMRHGVTIAADIILKIFDYPVQRSGLLLSLGDHEIYMGQPCSGFRSLITMLALGLVYVYIRPSPFKRKVALLLAIIPLALFGNLIRTTMTCLVAYYWGTEMAEGFFHELSGVIIFIILIGSMIWLDRHLEEKEQNE